jgi:hypothetical protein
MPFQPLSRLTTLANRFKLSVASIAALAAFSLFLASVPVWMIQYQRSQADYLQAQNKVDSLLWITYQFEREHGRLRDALSTAFYTPSTDALQDVILRYDIFYSRFDLVKATPTLEFLRTSFEYRAVLTALDAFVKNADPVMTQLDLTPAGAAVH